MATKLQHLTVAGELVTIRPIRATDARMESEFVRKLSPLTKHYRFLGGLKELTPAQAKTFCEVDGRHAMAFVATVNEHGLEIEIGVGRHAPNTKADVREMAVTISDDWQHKTAAAAGLLQALVLTQTRWIIEILRGCSVLGPLETKVLNALWGSGRAVTVRHLLAAFPDLAYTTLMTTLDRLYRKGVLLRRRRGRAFVYEPRCSHEQMLKERASDQIASLLAAPSASSAILSTLVHCVSRKDAALLDELDALVQAERARLKMADE